MNQSRETRATRQLSSGVKKSKMDVNTFRQANVNPVGGYAVADVELLPGELFAASRAIILYASVGGRGVKGVSG